MNILMLSSTFPYPPSRGGTEVRTFNLLKYLHQRHAVSLVTQRHEQVSDAEVEALRHFASSLVIFPHSSDSMSRGGSHTWLRKGGRFLESMRKATPPNVLQRYSPEMQGFVDTYVKQGKCEVITCEHSVNEMYVRPEFRESVRTVVNVHSSVYWGIRKNLEIGASTNQVRDRLYLPLLYRYEKRYCAKFSHIVATTSDDKQQMLQLSPNAKISTIPNGVDLDLFPPRVKDPGGHTLIFVGAMDLSHNMDAAQFFALEVLPQVRQRYPDATFRIVGTRPAPAILALEKLPGVIVTGKVPSMSSELHKATVCVVPLRTGFGIKNKTLEAMAAGTPVVGSDRGLEGIDIGTGKHIRALRANRVQEYVDAISQLFEDRRLREELSGNARSLIETEYTWEIVGKRYEQLLLQLPVG